MPWQKNLHVCIVANCQSSVFSLVCSKFFHKSSRLSVCLMLFVFPFSSGITRLPSFSLMLECHPDCLRIICLEKQKSGVPLSKKDIIFIPTEQTLLKIVVFGYPTSTLLAT